MRNSYKRGKYTSYNSGRYKSSSYKRYRYKRGKGRAPKIDVDTIKKIALGVGVVALLAGFVFGFSLLVKNCSCEDCAKNMPELPTRSTEITTKETEKETVKESTKKETESQKPEPLELISPVINDEGGNGKTDGEFYIWNDKIFKAFSGKTGEAEAYADAINGVKKALGDKIDVSSMLVPTHIEMGLPSRLKNSEKGIDTESQAQYIKDAYSKFGENVNAINCYNPLAKSCDEFNYFDTDYHWTALGAYQGYSAFAKANSLTPISLDSLEKKKVKNFHGSYQAFYKDFGIDNETVEYWDYSDKYSVTIDVTTYDGDVEKAYSCFYTGSANENDKYIVFLQGNYPLKEISSNSNDATEDKICIVHEGFSNSMVSYFTYNYKKVYSVNLDYWGGNLKDFCKKKGIDKVLFVNDVASSADEKTLEQIKELVK